MHKEININIREAISQEYSIISEHFYQMWLDIGVDQNSIKYNYRDIILEFIKQGRQNLFYKGFVSSSV